MLVQNNNCNDNLKKMFLHVGNKISKRGKKSFIKERPLTLLV